MRLSKAGYYADFVVYPSLLVVLGLPALHGASVVRHWSLAFVAGLAGWSLVEFVVHRYILHHVPPFRQLHALHHADPTALIGTPTWLSFALIGAVVFAPLWLEAGIDLASGATAGLVVGYLWYVSVHHAVHRWRARPGSYLFKAKVRHAWHHRTGASCNFGVTTGWWDVVLGTARMSTTDSAI